MHGFFHRFFPGQCRLSRFRESGLAPLVLLIAALPLLWACSSLSVGHLDNRSLETGNSDEVQLKFWRIAYTPRAQGDSILRVTGTAYPKDVIPGWAEWSRELWFDCYLADAEGRVLTKDRMIILPTKLDFENGHPLEFTIDASGLDRENLFLTFGYSMTLSSGRFHGSILESRRKPLTSDQEVFFASETALARF